MPILVFDIETVPDYNLGKKSFPKLSTLDEEQIIQAMTTIHKQNQSINGIKYPTSFLPHYMHKIVAISVLVRTRDNIKLWSLGEEDSSEKEIIQRFFSGIDKYTPELVSWNGGGFDLPVLNHRALFNGINSAKYWDTGMLDSNFKWNNYQNRYHQRHIDLMDVLAMHQVRANAPLNEVAIGLGLPGKMGLSGKQVTDMYLQGNIKSIRDYCETDVLNTYLVFLAFQRIRNHNSELGIEEEYEIIKDYLRKENKPHFDEFLEYWTNNE